MRTKRFKVQTKLVIILVIAFFMVSVQSHASNNTQGTKINIITKEGKIFYGELLSVSGRTLVLFDKSNEKMLQVAIEDITDLTIPHKKNFIKHLTKGAVMGLAALMAINSTEDSKIDWEYRIPQKVLFGAMGAISGTLGTFFLSPGKHYFLKNMQNQEIDSLLTKLDQSSRENVDSTKSFKNGLLGRFRFSWKPFYNHDFRYESKMNTELPADITPVDGIKNENSLFAFDNYNDPEHAVRFRLDYAMNDKLSIGAEYIYLGKHSLFFSGSGTLPLEGKDRFYSFYFYGNHSANICLLGPSYQVPTGSSLIGLRIESGIGASFSSLKKSIYYEPEFTLKSFDEINVIKPAFQIGITLEPYPNDIISTGIYVSYLYAPSEFSKFHATGTVAFYNNTNYYVPEFTHDVNFSIPKTTKNIGGLSLGLIVRIR